MEGLETTILPGLFVASSTDRPITSLKVHVLMKDNNNKNKKVSDMIKNEHTVTRKPKHTEEEGWTMEQFPSNEGYISTMVICQACFPFPFGSPI